MDSRASPGPDSCLRWGDRVNGDWAGMTGLGLGWRVGARITNLYRHSSEGWNLCTGDPSRRWGDRVNGVWAGMTFICSGTGVRASLGCWIYIVIPAEAGIHFVKKVGPQPSLAWRVLGWD